jgi:hypothetical protein
VGELRALSGKSTAKIFACILVDSLTDEINDMDATSMALLRPRPSYRIGNAAWSNWFSVNWTPNSSLVVSRRMQSKRAIACMISSVGKYVGQNETSEERCSV